MLLSEANYVVHIMLENVSKHIDDVYTHDHAFIVLLILLHVCVLNQRLI